MNERLKTFVRGAFIGNLVGIPTGFAVDNGVLTYVDVSYTYLISELKKKDIETIPMDTLFSSNIDEITKKNIYSFTLQKLTDGIVKDIRSISSYTRFKESLDRKTVYQRVKTFNLFIVQNLWELEFNQESFDKVMTETQKIFDTDCEDELAAFEATKLVFERVARLKPFATLKKT
jgi:hypothetical protein